MEMCDTCINRTCQYRVKTNIYVCVCVCVCVCEYYDINNTTTIQLTKHGMMERILL